MKTFSLTPTPNAAQIAEMRQAQLYPHNIRVFADRTHWGAGSDGTPNDNPPPTGPGTMKLWRDNAALGGPDGMWYIFVGPSMILNAYNQSLGTTGYNGSVGFQDPRPSGVGLLDKVTFGILSHGAAKFYQSQAKHFPTIPSLKLVWIERAAAFRMNFSGTEPVSIAPIGFLMPDDVGPINFVRGNTLDFGAQETAEKYRATFPSDMAIAYDSDGKPHAFRFVEWKAPADTGSGTWMGAGMSDFDLVEAVSGIVNSPFPTVEKAKRIRTFAGKVA